MKKYKLLKDLPFAKAGEVFKLEKEIETCCELYSLKRNPRKFVRAMDIDNIEEWFEEMEKKWKPEKEESYYYISNSCEVEEDVWEGFDIDSDRFMIGNVFKTELKARKQRTKLICWNVLKRSSDFEPDWSNRGESKWIVSYDFDLKRFEYGLILTQKMVQPCYFRTDEEARESVKIYEREWKKILGVEE